MSYFEIDPCRQTITKLFNLSYERLVENMARFCLWNDEQQQWRPVTWNEIGYSHLAYWDEAAGEWRPVPGRERLLEAFLQEGRQSE